MKLRVAVVDDDLSLRRSLDNLLSSSGLQVDTFASAEDLLAEANLAEVDVVVLDIRMRKMSGLELLVELRRLRPSLPVVVLTAYSDHDVREKCLRAGAAAFLDKPFRTDALLATLLASCGRA